MSQNIQMEVERGREEERNICPYVERTEQYKDLTGSLREIQATQGSNYPEDDTLAGIQALP